MVAHDKAKAIAERLPLSSSQAAWAVDVATDGIVDALNEEKALVAGATAAAHQAVDDAKQVLSDVTDVTQKAVTAATDAFNSAKDAVSDFANKIASGFFGALSSILSYRHAKPHLMEYHRRVHEEIIAHYGQSRSTTQSMPLSSRRKLLGLFGGIFTTVYNGIAGALDFIKGQLDVAVRDTSNYRCDSVFRSLSYCIVLTHFYLGNTLSVCAVR
jgi:hypothetical protein